MRVMATCAYFPAGGGDVGVIVSGWRRYRCSIVDRICDTLAPDLCICIASRATSMQIAHVIPCGSHIGRPLASRLWMKQSSLSLCPEFWHPQKQGT